MDLNYFVPEWFSTFSQSSTTVFQDNILERRTQPIKHRKLSWVQKRYRRKEFAMWTSIGLTIVSLIFIFFTIKLTTLQIRLSNQPYLIISNSNEVHDIDLRGELQTNHHGKLTKLPYLRFESSPYARKYKMFAGIPLNNYGNGNAVNVKVSMELNKDSTIKILKNIFSESFIDSCIFKRSGILLPSEGQRQEFIPYQKIDSFYVVENNSDTANCVYFSLPYYYYYLKFLQFFFHTEYQEYVDLPVAVRLEYEDISGKKNNETYILRYNVYGGGSSGGHASGGGEIIAKRINSKNKSKFRTVMSFLKPS